MIEDHWVAVVVSIGICMIYLGALISSAIIIDKYHLDSPTLYQRIMCILSNGFIIFNGILLVSLLIWMFKQI